MSTRERSRSPRDQLPASFEDFLNCFPTFAEFVDKSTEDYIGLQRCWDVNPSLVVQSFRKRGMDFKHGQLGFPAGFPQQFIESSRCVSGIAELPRGISVSAGGVTDVSAEFQWFREPMDWPMEISRKGVLREVKVPPTFGLCIFDGLPTRHI